jgi:hypothetical protein
MSRPVRKFAFLSLLATLAVLSSQAAAQPQAADSTWFRKLPSGVTVELLGINDPETKPTAWWTPAGKPLDLPITKSGFGRSKGGVQLRNFVVRVEGPSKDELDVIWDFGKSYGAESGNLLVKGDPDPGLDFAGVELPYEAERWTIRMKVCAARWVTDASRTADGTVKSSNKDRSVTFSPPHAIERGTAVVVAEDFPERDVRVVAFDKSGKQRSEWISRAGWYSRAFRLHDASFIGIKPEEIDRIELQSRPLETVEFQDVPLRAPKH